MADALGGDASAGQLLAWAAGQLRAGGVGSPRLEAELLLGHVIRCDRVALLAHPERSLSLAQEAEFGELLKRRLRAEPMAYLLGQREFYGRLFRSDARALIPRPETELLVELGCAAIDAWRTDGVEPRVVEIGTGAGAVAISVALERTITIAATDISWAALTLARENAEQLNALDRIRLLQADLLAGVSGPLHVVLANLPYVPNARPLPSDVRDYEPHVALFGGRRGTELIERLLQQAQPLLEPGATLCVELDEEAQAQPVAALARTLYRTGAVSIARDAGGYDRVVQVRT